MVLAYHVIFCAYGFWLPNDPRGSWSDFVGAWELLRFGPATKTNARRSVAGASHDWASRRAAKTALKYPPVSFNGIQARAIARGFSLCDGFVIYSCSILPEHVHMVIGRHAYPIETIVNQLKGRATRQLRAEGVCPESNCWARGQWKVFLNSQRDIERAIRYVEGNPEKEGLRPQQWSFIV
jgi:REP element-mobilizing transposase RayT